MKRIFLILLLASSTLSLGCIKAPLEPPQGFAFNDTITPLDLDYDQTRIYLKKGEASTESYFGLFSTGDAGIKAAAENGGLSKVDYADYRYLNIFGVYQKYTTIVYGE